MHRVERVANLSIVVLCAVVGIRLIFDSASDRHPVPNTNVGSVAYVPGDSVVVAGIDFGRSNHSLILVLSSGCIHCLSPSRQSAKRLSV